MRNGANKYIKKIQEIEKVADQCVVFYHGTIHAVLNRNEIDETTVMLHATGAVPETYANYR
ncbi:hypothetical protein FACS1894164_21390 [Spirochaetia bacterium]|nr:hypothetical protein FACS1894164_21390 [Spirochaetia bacterium]